MLRLHSTRMPSLGAAEASCTHPPPSGVHVNLSESPQLTDAPVLYGGVWQVNAPSQGQ